MSKALIGLAEVQSTMLITDENRSKVIRAMSELKKLKAENEKLKKDKEWISVEDELPEVYGWFLVFDVSMPKKHGVTMGFFSGELKSNWLPLDSRDNYESMIVTHWQPLPEPPK